MLKAELDSPWRPLLVPQPASKAGDRRQSSPRSALSGWPVGALAGLRDPGACARPPGSPPGLQRARCFKCKRPGVPGTDWVSSGQLSRGAGKPGPPHGTAGDVAAFRVHVSCLRHGRPEGRQSPLAGEVPAWRVPVGAGEGGERTHIAAAGCPSAGARSPPPHLPP